MDMSVKNLLLDKAYGTTRATGLPGTHTGRLYYGDPRDGGTEITGGGYAAITVAAADWLAAADARKATVPLQMVDATGEWSSEATHWALWDGADRWDVAAFEEPVQVTAAGPGPVVVFAVLWGDDMITGED